MILRPITILSPIMQLTVPSTTMVQTPCAVCRAAPAACDGPPFHDACTSPGALHHAVFWQLLELQAGAHVPGAVDVRHRTAVGWSDFDAVPCKGFCDTGYKLLAVCRGTMLRSRRAVGALSSGIPAC